MQCAADNLGLSFFFVKKTTWTRRSPFAVCGCRVVKTPKSCVRAPIRPRCRALLLLSTAGRDVPGCLFASLAKAARVFRFTYLPRSSAFPQCAAFVISTGPVVLVAGHYVFLYVRRVAFTSEIGTPVLLGCTHFFCAFFLFREEACT